MSHNFQRIASGVNLSVTRISEEEVEVHRVQYPVMRCQNCGKIVVGDEVESDTTEVKSVDTYDPGEWIDQ